MLHHLNRRITTKRAPKIELDTPILPHFIAKCVHEEAGVWLKRPLPRRWIRELSARANTVYARNEQFRRKLRAGGNRGRDCLWVFMRHWLAGLLWRHRPNLHGWLPASYGNETRLPPPPPPPLSYPYARAPVKMVRRMTQQVRPRLRPKPPPRTSIACESAERDAGHCCK